MFFSFDGVDGAGKSTQIKLFVEWLEQQNHEVVTCRDPGTTPVGEQLRNILLQSGTDTPIGPRCESLIFMAARAQLVPDVIRPALDAGKIVVSDRYLLATVVYQGYGLTLDAEQLWKVGEFATDNLLPDHTIVLDVDVEKAAARREGDADRMESRDVEYFQKLRKGFVAEAKKSPHRISVIDASQSIEAVHADIKEKIQPLLVNK